MEQMDTHGPCSHSVLEWTCGNWSNWSLAFSRIKILSLQESPWIFLNMLFISCFPSMGGTLSHHLIFGFSLTKTIQRAIGVPPWRAENPSDVSRIMFDPNFFSRETSWWSPWSAARTECHGEVRKSILMQFNHMQFNHPLTKNGLSWNGATQEWLVFVRENPI